MYQYLQIVKGRYQEPDEGFDQSLFDEYINEKMQDMVDKATYLVQISMPNSTDTITDLYGKALDKLTDINISCKDLQQTLEDEPFKNCI